MQGVSTYLQQIKVSQKGMEHHQRMEKKSDLKCTHKEQFKWDSQPADTSRLPVSQAELYGIFFDDDILEMVVENSYLYAYSKGNT